jgi:DNA-binding MarR family transcriptional regulator
MSDPTDRDYRALLRFRHGLRQFLAFSEHAAADAGLTTQQHQLLLAIRGHDDEAPTTSGLADLLVLKNNSVVELVDRAVAAGLVERHPDPDDGRRQRIGLTDTGRRHLADLTAAHLEELRGLRDELVSALDDLGQNGRRPAPPERDGPSS